jgi:hypothetical protein
MIELLDADFQYDGEDIIGVALAQVVSLVAAVSAVIMLVSHTVGIVDGYGARLRIAFSGVLGPALAVGVIAGVAAIATRFSRVWNNKRGRKRIVTGLGQMAVTALVATAAGLILAGARLDLLISDQGVPTWVYYGLAIAGLLHLVVVLAALVLLLLRRDLPDFID